eukprot:SAG31_NODE_555_length_14169_cov_19.798721_11_plen_188_part_01
MHVVYMRVPEYFILVTHLVTMVGGAQPNMASSQELQRSSSKKARAAQATKKAVLDLLKQDEGDAFHIAMDRHRREMFTVYGTALTQGWTPQDITPDWLVGELRDKLKNDYEDDYFHIVWDEDFQPGLVAASQMPYTATKPEREIPTAPCRSYNMDYITDLAAAAGTGAVLCCGGAREESMVPVISFES